MCICIHMHAHRHHACKKEEGAREADRGEREREATTDLVDMALHSLHMLQDS